MLGRSDDSDLLNALFAAATQGDADVPWSSFLTRLADATHAETAALHLDLDSGETHHWQVGTMEIPALVQLRQMRNERIYSQVDLPAATQDTPLRAVKCALHRQGRISLILQHPQRDFRSLDGRQLSHLVPYLGQAVALWLQLRDSQARAEQDREIARSLGAGAIVFSRAGTILDIAPAAQAMIAAHPGLSLSAQQRLDCADPGRERALRSALNTALSEPDAPTFALLSDAPLLQLSLRAGLWGGRAALIGILRCEPRATDLPLNHLMRALGLNRSEARLAALLCDGLSLRDAATRLSWTIETARTCSKQIYARSGVSGQSGLLRRMLNGTIWFHGDQDKP